MRLAADSTRMASLQDRSRAAVWHPCTQMARLVDVPPLPLSLIHI